MLTKSVSMLSIMLCAGLLCISCKNPANSSNQAVTVARLKINNGDVSGWTVVNSNVYYTVDNWANNSVDGVDGTAYGLSNLSTYSEVLDEHMGGSNGTVVIWVLNYTTAANSTEQYNSTKTGISSNAEPLSPNFADTVAIGNNSSNSITVYAHFKQFYIQLGFAGYTDFPLSKTDAITFLQVLEAKINGM